MEKSHGSDIQITHCRRSLDLTRLTGKMLRFERRCRRHRHRQIAKLRNALISNSTMGKVLASTARYDCGTLRG